MSRILLSKILESTTYIYTKRIHCYIFGHVSNENDNDDDGDAVAEY